MARTNKDKKSKHIDPNTLKVRDYYMVAIINGATKCGVIPDRRKRADKYRCRNSRNPEWD